MVGILASVGTAVVTGLASGVASKISGEATGWVLDEIFGDPNDEQAQAIEKLGMQLTQVADAVAAMDRELKTDMKMIQAELKAIEQEQLYIAWEIRDNDLQNYITQINVQYNRFIEYAGNPQTTSQQEVTNLVEEILNTNNGAAVVMAQINTLLTGSGSNKSVLQLYTEMIAPLIMDGKQSCYSALDGYFNYYVNAAYAQQRALYLLVEAYHQQNNDPVAQEQRISYQNFVKSQEIPFVSSIDMMLRQELKGGIRQTSDYRSFSLDYCKGLQDYSGQAFYSGHYNPTPARAKAERILTNSLCLKSTDNRLVVWMIYPTLSDCYPHYPQKDFDGLDVLVSVAGNPSAHGISPDYSDIVAIVADDNPGYDYYNKQHKFKRMVYQNLPGGSYVLKDMNNTQGLDPVDGSNQQINYFEAPKYLAYQMILNTTVQGNFMDFSVYADRRNAVYGYSYTP